MSLVLVLSLSGLVAYTAHAHAEIDRCEPSPGSSILSPPSEVRCWFTEELDPKGSTLSVLDAEGNAGSRRRPRRPERSRSQATGGFPGSRPDETRNLHGALAHTFSGRWRYCRRDLCFHTSASPRFHGFPTAYPFPYTDSSRIATRLDSALSHEHSDPLLSSYRPPEASPMGTAGSRPDRPGPPWDRRAGHPPAWINPDRRDSLCAGGWEDGFF